MNFQIKHRPLLAVISLLCCCLVVTGCGQTNSGLIKAVSGKLYYEEKGKGETIVLGSGGAFSGLEQWRPTFDYLSQYYHVISYDPTGVGRSDSPGASYSNAADLKALCDSLKIDKAVFIGLSYSGAIVLEFAILNPERVKALVLSGPLVRGFAPSEAMKKRFDDFAVATELGPDSLLPTLFDDQYFIPSAKNDRELWEKFQKMLRSNYRTVDGSFEIRMDPPAAQRVHEIRVPTLIITGELDHPDLHRRAKFLEGAIPGSQTKIITKAGHLVNLEAPEEFNRLVREFLTTLNL